MKNLFHYATKELSQDAFLRWLFENYNCENESVKLASRRLFESFTSSNGDDSLNFEDVTDLSTQAQWKNIDISIHFKINGKNYMIVIEDKTDSNEHNQLEVYNRQLDKCPVSNSCIYKIFYKTNIIDSAERSRVAQQGWRIYDIFDIVPLFSNIDATSEVLAYYIESIHSIQDSALRTMLPSEWDLTAWHSFFNDYVPISHISAHKEVACYQKAYFYLKLFAKDHISDMPSLEIRSRDFMQKDGKYIITARAVLYTFQGSASREMIQAWQSEMQKKLPGFIPSYRKDLSRHKQIGRIDWIIDNSESSLRASFDAISQLLV